MANASQRGEMLEIALRESGFDWAEVSSFELERPPELLVANREALLDRLPADGMVLDPRHRPVGADRPLGRPEILRELLHFLVFTREGEAVRDRPGWRRTAIPFAHPASSTAIRADLAGHQDWLRPACFVIAGNRASTPDPIAQISGKFPHWCEIT